MNYFTLHVRLTNSCQADCYYCSSWKEEPTSIESSEKYREYLDFVWENYIVKYNISFEEISIEYVGGEVLLIDPSKLNAIVETGRRFFREKNIDVIDGIQSNLVVSNRRLQNAVELFSNRIGTSIDNISNSRTIDGSPEKYKEIFDFNEKNYIKRKTPAVFTVTNNNISKAIEQLRICYEEGRNITFRHIFSGGQSTELINTDDLAEFYSTLAEEYICKKNIIVEPIHNIIKGRLQEKASYDLRGCHTSCPFQNNCSRKSLSIDPNGDLYTCQEMSDTSNFKLGNADLKILNTENINIINKRQLRLPDNCYTCEYFNTCQGGCMMESIQFHDDPYNKSIYCSAWKKLFKTIDERIDFYGAKKVIIWMNENES